MFHKVKNSKSNLQAQFNFKTRGIPVANLNIRHRKPNINEVKIMLDLSNCIDIFGVCETYLNQSIIVLSMPTVINLKERIDTRSLFLSILKMVVF